MPFSLRSFCRDLASPSLSEVLLWLRQHGHPKAITAGASAGDLLSCFWTEVQLSDDQDQPWFRMTSVRADQAGAARLGEEVSDFVADVGELPPTAARARVLEHLAATRALVIIELPLDGGSEDAHEAAISIQELFRERAGGMAQRDGSGFLDEDEIILAIA